MSKVEKQQPEKEKTADQPQQGRNDDDDMPMLVSDDENPNPGQGAIRKWFVGKKMVGLKLSHKKLNAFKRSNSQLQQPEAAQHTPLVVNQCYLC